jgi:hypothetical protein
MANEVTFSAEELAMLKPPPETPERAEPREAPPEVDAGNDEALSRAPPAPEVVAGDEDDAGDGEETAKPTPPTSVPHRKYAEERQRRQQLERERDEQRRWQQTAEQRLQQLYQHAQAQVPQQRAPTLQDDPGAFVETMAQKVDRLEREAHDRQRHEAQQREQVTVKAQLDDRFGRELEDLRQDIPDLQQGLDFFAQQRQQELTMAGYPPHVVAQMLQQDIYGTIAAHYQAGRSPAQFFYEVAKLRGYRGGPAPAAVPNGTASNGTAAHLQAVAAGQRTAKSLSSVGGSSPAVARKFTLDDLAKMPQDEFERRLQKGGDKWFRSIAGG